MSQYELVKWTHLLAAATWTGGMFTLAFLVGAARKAGADIEVLRAVARRFAVVSWWAMAIAVAAGLRMFLWLQIPWGDFWLKGTLVSLSIALTLFHQVTAKRTSPAVRGALQAVLLVLAVAIFGAAVAFT